MEQGENMTQISSNLRLVAGLITAAIATYAGSASAEGSVKVECWGDCFRVNLGQVCDFYGPGARPYAISCDDSQVMGQGGGQSKACGYGGDTCTEYSTLGVFDRVGDYCADGPGMDAIVYCR